MTTKSIYEAGEVMIVRNTGSKAQSSAGGVARTQCGTCSVLRFPRFLAGFTLIELLVVIAIMAIMGAIGIAGWRGMNRSNAAIATTRKMLDDVAYARQRAIAEHTTVYMVFVPPYVINYTPQGSDPVSLKRQYTNLYGAQYTTYALLSLRLIGEQPGRATPHYLTDWRTLPEGMFIATNKFGNYNSNDNHYTRAFPIGNFPFPQATNALRVLPYIGFDYLGRLVTGQDECIPLAFGSVFHERGLDGNFIAATADAQENPAANSVNNSNVIRINWITGRAKLERPEIQ